MSGWRDDAACKGKTDLFVPGHMLPGDIAAAKEICRTCPVIGECRADFNAAKREGWTPLGVWFGTSDDDRAGRTRIRDPRPALTPERRAELEADRLRDSIHRARPRLRVVS